MRDEDMRRVEREIQLLADRGYIRKSELMALSDSCEDPAVSLEELKNIVLRLQQDGVLYIDDTETATDDAWFHAAIQLRHDLSRENYEGLCGYLKAPANMDHSMMLVILQDLTSAGHWCPLLETISFLLSSEQKFCRYRLIEDAGFLWDRLTILLREGVTILYSEEREELAQELSERIGLNATEASDLIERGMRALGIRSDAHDLSDERASRFPKEEDPEAPQQAFHEGNAKSPQEKDQKREIKLHVTRRRGRK
jgi:hypothetical protein